MTTNEPTPIRPSRADGGDVAAMLGFTLVTAGVLLVSIPLALVVAGALLLALAVWSEWRSR